MGSGGQPRGALGHGSGQTSPPTRHRGDVMVALTPWSDALASPVTDQNTGEEIGLTEVIGTSRLTETEDGLENESLLAPYEVSDI